MNLINANLRDCLLHAPAVARLGAFLLILALAWLPFVVGIPAIASDPNTANILVMATLFVEFVVWVYIWGRWLYRHPCLFRRYGLIFSRRNGSELLQGLALGSISIGSLFIFQGLLGWLSWNDVPASILRISLEGLLVGLGVGLAEELLFRGWLLDELEQDSPLTASLWASSFAYAVLHFIRPVDEILRTAAQFPGLVVLGLILVWGKRSHHGRLGFPIGLHGGLVWGYYLIDVGDWVSYSPRIPEWLFGINQNPLSGVIGLLFLIGLACVIRQPWQSQIKSVEHR